MNRATYVEAFALQTPQFDVNGRCARSLISELYRAKNGSAGMISQGSYSSPRSRLKILAACRIRCQENEGKLKSNGNYQRQ
jgi:hypothetical protein